ncbi:MAG: 4Fe-4S binding protein, partial [Candidatus Thorarchaeota archaeon]
MSIKIDGELCTACESCVNACPYGGIEIIEGVAVITGDCNLCGACVDACPVEAIILERAEYIDKVDKTKYQGVWIIAEHYKREFPKVVFQLISKGRELADLLHTSVSVIILGDKFEEQLEDFGEYGVDEIIYVRSPILKNYYSDLYVNILVDLISQ